jgi:hypothetical protein
MVFRRHPTRSLLRPRHQKLALDGPEHCAVLLAALGGAVLSAGSVEAI